MQIHLTAEKVIASASVALNSGTLQCQWQINEGFKLNESSYGLPVGGGCTYSGDNSGGARCAIGTAFTDDEIHYLRQRHLDHAPITKLVEDGVVVCSPRDLSFFLHLQFLHDNKRVDSLREALKAPATHRVMNQPMVATYEAIDAAFAGLAGDVKAFAPKPVFISLPLSPPEPLNIIPFPAPAVKKDYAFWGLDKIKIAA